MDVIGIKKVKTRKPHVCFGCGRTFDAGTIMQRECVVDGTAWTCYLCETCEEIESNFKKIDKDVDFFGFGDLREYVLEFERNGGGINGLDKC